MAQLVQMAIVPAQPGFSVVETVTEGDHVVALHFEPILAWHVEVWKAPAPGARDYGEPFALTYPVTVSGGMEASAVRFPDGRICFVENMTVGSEEEALAEFRRQEAWS